ncbi:MAG: hypothetical protein EXR68_06760 [Dehalococcoidia bacterium]|nr:hypothetical protein [Dehalococcoidia bacterium]
MVQQSKPAPLVQKARRTRPIAPSELYRAPVELLSARRVDLLTYLNGAFDVAEGQPAGHAVRVAYLALAFARRLRLDVATRRQVLHVALLHDSGVAVRELPAEVDASGGYTAAGAWVASLMGLEDAIQDAIRCTHKR